jgi:hypothetical protein
VEEYHVIKKDLSWNLLRKLTNFLCIHLLPGLPHDAKLWKSTPRIRYSKTIMRIATKDNTTMYYVGFEDATFSAETSR